MKYQTIVELIRVRSSFRNQQVAFDGIERIKRTVMIAALSSELPPMPARRVMSERTRHANERIHATNGIQRIFPRINYSLSNVIYESVKVMQTYAFTISFDFAVDNAYIFANAHPSDRTII